MWLFLLAFLLTLIIMGFLISAIATYLIPTKPEPMSPPSGSSEIRKCG
jgi:hypothetical protein